MRLAVYAGADGERTGLVVGGTLFDLPRSVELYGRAHVVELSDPRTIAANAAAHLGLLRHTAEQAEQALARGAGAEAMVGPVEPDLLRAPVPSPAKILCIGLNYHDHAAEVGAATPSRPHVFSKLPTAVVGPRDDIRFPVGTASEVDYEVELAFVIGRRASGVTTAKALDHVLGYLVVNDVSARDWQFAADNQLTLGKGFDTFLPSGPWLVTADEIPDPQRLRIRCLVNGAVRQDASTADMVFGVAEILSFLSTVCTLEPGDLVATGTPAGVGVGRNPPGFLQPGDEVVSEIESIGSIRNRVTIP